MKNEKLTIIHSILFLILIIFSIIFFTYTNGVVYETTNGSIIDSSYSTVNLIINTLIIIFSLAIIELSIISIRKLPKKKDDYNKALVISNIILGTLLNLFIVFWPIAQYILKCQ